MDSSTIQFKMTGYKIATVIVLLLSYGVTYLVFKGVFKNFNRKVMSIQRKYRIGSTVALIGMQFFLTLETVFGRFLGRDGSFKRPSDEPFVDCNTIGYLAAVSGVGFTYTLQMIFIMSTFATIDRYKKLNMIVPGHRSFRKYSIFQHFLVVFYVISCFFGTVVFASLCFSNGQSWVDIGQMIMGLFTITSLITDAVVNLKMISNIIKNQKIPDNLHPPHTYWGAFLNKVGFKWEIFGYFSLVSFVGIVEVVIMLSEDSMIEGLTELEKRDISALSNAVLMSFGIPVYNLCVYKLLDLFLAVIKNPYSVRVFGRNNNNIEHRDKLNSGENSISFFASRRTSVEGSTENWIDSVVEPLERNEMDEME